MLLCCDGRNAAMVGGKPRSWGSRNLWAADALEAPVTDLNSANPKDNENAGQTGLYTVHAHFGSKNILSTLELSFWWLRGLFQDKGRIIEVDMSHDRS